MVIKGLETVLKDLDGDELPYKAGKSLTLKIVCSTAILNPFEKEMNVLDKMKFFTMAQKINSAKDDVVLTVSEVENLKKAINFSYGTLVACIAINLIKKSEDKE